MDLPRQKPQAAIKSPRPWSLSRGAILLLLAGVAAFAYGLIGGMVG